MTLWELLGVSRGCSTEDLTAAYRKKCKELHPDLTGNDPNKTKLFVSMKTVYEKVMERRRTNGIESPESPQQSNSPYTSSTSAGSAAAFTNFFTSQDLYRVYEEMQRDGLMGKKPFDEFMKKKNAAADILRKGKTSGQ